MNLVFALLAGLILASAACAMTRRNLIYSALLLILTWTGIAGFYLWAGAEFLAFAQALIYIGAVSMVVLFAILLTRPSDATLAVTPASRRRTVGAVLLGAAIAVVLSAAVLSTPFGPVAERAPSVNVRQLGHQLMGAHAASLLVIGLILTVALLGATIIASVDQPNKREDAS